MASRFRLEPHTTLQKLTTSIRHPMRWRDKTTAWVQDKAGGTRFQLARDEDELVHALSANLRDNPKLEATLDEVADAILWRRQGYVFKWDAVANNSLAPRNTSSSSNVPSRSTKPSLRSSSADDELVSFSPQHS